MLKIGRFIIAGQSWPAICSLRISGLKAFDEDKFFVK